MRSLSTRAAGLLILILGVWGGLVPFIAPYFHFALGPDKSWTWTSGRLFLSVIPAAVAVLGGLMLIGAGAHASARPGALLAIAAGVWFAIGPDVSHLWNSAGAVGAAHGSTGIRTLEMVAYHSGLGAVIAALGGYALPRFIATPAVEPATRDAAISRRRGAPVSEREAASDEPPATTPPSAERRPVSAGKPVAERRATDDPALADHQAAEAPTVAGGRVADGAGTIGHAAAGEPTMTDREAVDAPGPADRAAAQKPAVAERGASGEPSVAGRSAESDDDARASASTPSEAGDRSASGAAETAPASDGAGQYGDRGHVVRRRRGGLLSSLLPRR
jgi:hypothetical protein